MENVISKNKMELLRIIESWDREDVQNLGLIWMQLSLIEKNEGSKLDVNRYRKVHPDFLGRWPKFSDKDLALIYAVDKTGKCLVRYQNDAEGFFYYETLEYLEIVRGV